MKKAIFSSILAVLIVLVVIFLPQIVILSTDWYWFQALGLEGVFETRIRAQILVGVFAFVTSFVFLWLQLYTVNRISKKDADVIASASRFRSFFSRFRSGSANVISRLSLLAIVVLSVLIALGMTSAWEIVLLYMNQVPFGEVDPLFGRDVSYYVFSIPFWKLLISYGFWIIILSLIFSLALYALRGGFSIQTSGKNPAFSMDKVPKLHVSFLLGLLFILVAIRTYAIRIPEFVYSQSSTFTGASYVDVYANIPVQKILGVLALLVGLFLILHLFRPSRTLVVSSFGLYVVVLILGSVIYPVVLQRFVVLPNELNKETPYLEDHIESTRQAFLLDNVEERDLTGESTLSLQDIEDNQATIQNIRLWDRKPLLDTFGQIQEIRTYYGFGSVDNDRYMVDGEYRQVLLSPRELETEALPVRNFINDHLTFTHGFGVTVSPVNEVTPQGLPVLFAKDIPSVSEVDAFETNQPAIYYGEETNDYVVTKTQANEFHYPSGDENVYTDYEGNGGVEVSSFGKKALFALRFGSLKFLLSDDIVSESRVMFDRNIVERTEKVLPFIAFDEDPYIVVTEDGSLKWILDGYTSTNRYPYAQTVSYRTTDDVYAYSTNLNYIRNSVKVVVDAYDGSMNLYVADSDDPIIQAYSQIFEGAFEPLSNMNDDLLTHIRYPEDIFKLQTELYSTYHMDEAQIFYNKEDQWEIPRLTGSDKTDPMMRHNIMRLPGEEKEEFIFMLPYTPRQKDNLAAWMVARNDGDHYGELVVYRFPKQRLVYGPQQVVNRINQDAEISGQISLWDQRGSEVNFGNLFVIPINESLLYVRPVYLRAEGGNIPELKRVIVVYEDAIAMRETLSEALAAVFSGTVESAASEDGSEITSDVSTSLTNDELILELETYFNAALEAQKQGDWSTYGEKIKQVEEIISQLQ